LIDRDEPRFAEASREMIERADYVVPHFNNGLRLDKPPLAYWAQIASYRIFGANDFAARFPSTIAAALVALSIFAWGKRIADERVGLWAAIIFTLSLQTFLHAKAAVADMWLVLFMTLAHWAGYELAIRGAAISRAPWAIWKSPFLVFYFSLAFGFLAKGPIAWTPLLTVASTRLFAPQFALARQFKFVRGILLTIAIVALWGIPALIRTDGEFLTIGIGRHVVGRSFGAMEGHGANSFGLYLLLLPFYFATIFISFFPWSIKLPSLMAKLSRKQAAGVTDPGHNRDKIDNYLFAGAAIIFIIFTLIKTKLPHYTLPAFPLLSLLLARHCIESERFFRRCAIVAACIYVAVALFTAPVAARFFPAAQLYRESRDYLRPEMQFGAVGFNEPSVVWYFRSRVSGFLTPLKKGGAADFMAGTGARFIILPTALVGDLFANRPANWKNFQTRGFNVAKGKQVDLTLILKPE
jgi:4-amino-4-deoxy-L-arabinose transferase-like glycosyltransferase